MLLGLFLILFSQTLIRGLAFFFWCFFFSVFLFWLVGLGLSGSGVFKFFLKAHSSTGGKLQVINKQIMVNEGEEGDGKVS